jgi:glycosyltransferase involved in cell wall biosynthesis
MALKVSVIIPCYNEEATIRLVLEALLRQTYPLAQMEVVIADGMSTDRTRAEIAAFQEKHPTLNLRIVDNPKRDIPAALNTAIAAAKGEIIVRLDAHALPYPEYVARSVQGVEDGRGANVGGVWEIQPGGDTWAAEAIAFAAAHPLGVGDAKYRYTDAAAEVDTVPFGAFKKKLIEEIGGFDESLLTNEDYEFNVRVRKAGGKVWLDPGIRARYFARPSLSALAKQYARYGYWKVRMLRRYPKSLRWRQAIPPLFVLSLLGMGVLSIWFPLARWIWGGEVVLYALALLTSGLQAVFAKRKTTYIFGVPLAMMTMHFSWGGAFLWGLMTLMTNDKTDMSGQ